MIFGCADTRVHVNLLRNEALDLPLRMSMNHLTKVYKIPLNGIHIPLVIGILKERVGTVEPSCSIHA